MELEELANKAATDKARDEHGYVAVYSMLFDALRDRVRNMTEVGVHHGRSLRMWHGYFRFARIWGVDVALQPEALRAADELGERVRVLEANSTDGASITGVLGRANIRPGSMDLIVDDGDHTPMANALTLRLMWPFVKRGGFYIIEDVTTGGTASGDYFPVHGAKDAPGSSWLAHNVSGLPSGVREIYEQNDVFLADAMVGQRAFSDYYQRHKDAWMDDRVNHNSHLLVIRKRRAGPRKTRLARFSRNWNWPNKRVPPAA